HFRDKASHLTGELATATAGADLFLAKMNSTAPALNIDSPTRGSAASFVADESAFTLEATVSDDDLAANVVEWFLMPDEENPLGQSVIIDGSHKLTLPSGTLPIGDHLIKATITDSDGLTSVATTTVAVASGVYGSSDTPLTIPKSTNKNLGVGESTILVADSLTVSDVNVEMTLQWGEDLHHVNTVNVFLTSPDNTRIELFLGGQSGDQGNLVGTAFDDEAVVSIGSASQPFTGRFQPVTPLSSFDGESSAGDWKL
ncbi:unnamed protein product, partial [marine sediment metagenome]